MVKHGHKRIVITKNRRQKQLWFFNVYEYHGFFQKYQVASGGNHFRGNKPQLMKMLHHKYPKVPIQQRTKWGDKFHWED